MKNIVVTGASGNIGSRVVSGLLSREQRGHSNVVAFVRDGAKAANLAVAGATIRLGTFEDPAALAAGIAGADVLVLITSGARLAEQASAAITAARAAGVQKIVRISSLKADVDGPTDAARQDGRGEATLRDSGIAHVILRGHCFMQNLFHSVPSIRAQGKLYFGVGSGKIGMIDARDIADAAVAAATNETWDGQTLELTGPAAIDYFAVATAIGNELGREVTYVPLPPAAIGEAARAHGSDDWTAQVTTEYCVAYAQGWGDFTTDSVEKLTRHVPRSIADFVREVLAPRLR
jgi:uncharacterized protein YbjT (DUF2867 family)